MVIRLDLVIYVIDDIGTKKRGWVKGCMVEEVCELLGFVVLVHVLFISVVVVEGPCVSRCRG
jgi:hypothetical protein